MISVIWDEENIEHVAEHGLTPEEVDSVLLNDSLALTKSRSSGLQLASERQIPVGIFS